MRDAAKYAKASETSSNKSSKEKQEKKNIREKRKRPKVRASKIRLPSRWLLFKFLLGNEVLEINRKTLE